MSTRLLHVIVPRDRLNSVVALVEPVAQQHWHAPLADGREHVTAVLPGPVVDRVVDKLERALGAVPEAAVTPVEAFLGAGMVPKAPPTGRPPTRLERFFSRNRLSTEELYDDIEGGTRLTATYVVFVVTSALIAALGIGMRSGNDRPQTN